MNHTITQKVGHLAWCALVAVKIAERDGQITSEVQKNLFLTRWLATAQKQRCFPREVAADIDWLLKQGRTLGIRAKLLSKMEYLYRSCSGILHEQHDLFRLTYAFDSAKEMGFFYQLLSQREWEGRYAVLLNNNIDGIYLPRESLEVVFNDNGMQTLPLVVKITGNVSGLSELLRQCGWNVREAEKEITPNIYILTAQKIFTEDEKNK